MWELKKVKDNELTVIKVDNGRALIVSIYYGAEATSDGMTKDEYNDCLRMFAASRTMLDALKAIVDAGPPGCIDSYCEEGVEYQWNNDVRNPALAAIYQATGKHYTPISSI